MFASLVSVQNFWRPRPGQLPPGHAKRPGADRPGQVRATGVIRQINFPGGERFRETAFSLGIIQANHFSILLMDTLLLAVTAIGISLLVLLSLQLRLPELRS